MPFAYSSVLPFSWSDPSEKKHAFLEAQKLAENNPEAFWHKEAHGLLWQRPWEKTLEGHFPHPQWFVGGELNASENCLDRHIGAGLGSKKAIIWESEDGHVQSLSYEQLYDLVLRICALLKKRGLKKGDRAAIYLPLIPEAIASMLACARLGVIHTVVFAGFSENSLKERLNDAQCSAVITADGGLRKGKPVLLKQAVDRALESDALIDVHTVLVFARLKQNCTQKEGRDIFFHEAEIKAPIDCVPEGFQSQHPLFILYTSGTTGKPKGIFHGTGGYLVQATTTARWIFDFQPDDVFWCTADIGWVTGHSYLTYAPLALGATIFLYEGALNQPSFARVYEMIDRHRITIFYTAPTAIRMFMQAESEKPANAKLETLRMLGSVGEPINPEAWRWYRQVFGRATLPLIDTWWQTETGTIMCSAIPGISPLIPGSAGPPFFGIRPLIVDEQGQEVEKGRAGNLVIGAPWPSLALGIWGDPERFQKTYFAKYPKYYFTGDGAIHDDQGNITIMGRIDDVVNVSGHRLGTAEIESALVSHKAVAEAAAVGIPHPLTGQALAAFVVLMPNYESSDDLLEALKNHVKESIGAFAKPSVIYVREALPKTRSGKIMRRLLRSLACGEKIQSDISTLEDVTALS